jgi:hypothetical protein
MRQFASRDRVWLWVSAAALPVVTNTAAIYVNMSPDWTPIPVSAWRALAADALLYTSAALVVSAPIAGVAATKIERQIDRDRDVSIRVARTIAISVLLFTAVSASITALEWGGAEGTLAFVATSHATIAAVAFALSALGAFCSTVWRDALDAAAISLVVALVAAGGLLVAGVSIADASPRALHAGLLASPFVVAATASQIDVVRLDTLYQISPLAHMHVDYPSWQAACGWYLAVGCVFFVGVTRRSRNRHPV